MEKQVKLYPSISAVAIATALILMVPLIAMQFTSEVNWGVFDFIIMGALIFSGGVSFVLVARYAANFLHRLAVAAAIGSTLLLIWANLAVGLIGSGPNPGNLMYIGIVLVMIIGTILSRFTAKGMERTMFATSLALVLLTVIALLNGMHTYPGSSVLEIVGINGFFATLFAVAGLLFQFVAMEQAKRTEQA